MPRPPRNFFLGGVFHVMSRGSQKQEIFHDRSDYETFLGFLWQLKNRFGVSIFHYVLMPNHIHLLLQLNSEFGSTFMQMLKVNYAKYYAEKYGKTGHLWQARFKSEHVDTDAYLLACGNYIEMNPVRAGLVDRPEDWPYSSYRHYAYGERNPHLETSPLYDALGRTDKERQENYRRQLAKTRAF